MRASRIVALSALSLGLWSSVAAADETATKPARKERSITLPTLELIGRRQRPQASVEVSRLVVKAPLPDLRQPLVDRIGAAVEKDPF